MPPLPTLPLLSRPRRVLRTAALACVLALAGGLWGLADSEFGQLHAGERDHELARQALQQGRVLPLRTVLDKIEREHQGQVIKIEFERDDGQFLYEISLLQSGGRLAKLEVDAVDGRVLKFKRKD